MARRRSDRVSVVEAAYAAVDTDEAWLHGLASAAEPHISEGLGACAYVYDASSAPLGVGPFAQVNLACPAELVIGAVQQTDEDYIANTWRKLSFGLGSEVVSFRDLPAASGLVAAGVHDMLAINAYDTSGIGVWIGAPLVHERRPRPNEAGSWTRVATHVATAFRLRRCASRADRPHDAVAVLSPSGKLDHARDGASADALRGKLGEAVRRMERARGPMRHRDQDGALDLWRALVDGNYTLLDHYERGGRRYIVAVENAPAAAGPEVLTPRERQVVAAAAAGRTNKLIAYELGLSDSTVRVLLTRASRKLATRSRQELVACYRAHERSRAS